MSTPHHNQDPSQDRPAQEPVDQVGPDRRRYFAGAAGALLLATGLGGAALAQASADPGTQAVGVESGAADRSDNQRAGRVSGDLDDGALDDVTLEELSDELERLGLEVRIAPSDAAAGDIRSDTDRDAVGDTDADETEIDPFEGMTDAEIDELSDEEFFARLEAAGIDPEFIDDDDIDIDIDIDGDSGLDGDSDDANDGDSDGDAPEGEEDPLATLAVDGDRIDTSNLSPEVARQAEAIWQRFAELIPADQRQMVANFELMPTGYDGAHVYPTDEDPSRWTIGVGADLGDDLDYVLVHEFGHLLTLQAKEVPPSEDNGSCTTYHTGEGCALKGSTFAKFVSAFWPEEMRNKVLDLYEAEDYDGLDAFYEENKDSFVTDYAASNPAEDLAETFAIFVTEDRPTGDTIADQKVELLWSDPDMVALRTQIRSNL